VTRFLEKCVTCGRQILTARGQGDRPVVLDPKAKVMHVLHEDGGLRAVPAENVMVLHEDCCAPRVPAAAGGGR